MKNLGFTDKIKNLLPADVTESELGRIIVEHKERYLLQSTEGVFNAEITGNLRFSANSRVDFPAVGDWVRFMKMDEKNAIIIDVMPRFSLLERQAVGKFGEVQVIAANIDHAFIVQAVGHDFNLNRLERYLSICYSSKINPIVLLTKIDLIDEGETTRLKDQILQRLANVAVIAISNLSKRGYTELEGIMQAYATYCFIGSSGVGKSTIINHLVSEEVLKTTEISISTNKGRHTTTHRELLVLPNKSIVIDTPGMREVGLTEQSSGIEQTYEQINELSLNCRFSDCSHTSESGCAVLEALESGALAEEVYTNYQKLKREQEHFTSTVHEKRKRDKDFGKMIKSVLTEKRKFKDR